MSKYNIVFGDTWKKGSFTLDEIAAIKAIKADSADNDEDLNALAECFIKRLARHRELIFAKAEWIYNRSYHETFFGYSRENVDIGITVMYYDYIGGKEVITRHFATFTEINGLTCDDDVEEIGRITRYAEVTE